MLMVLTGALLAAPGCAASSTRQFHLANGMEFCRGCLLLSSPGRVAGLGHCAPLPAIWWKLAGTAPDLDLRDPAAQCERSAAAYSLPLRLCFFFFLPFAIVVIVVVWNDRTEVRTPPPPPLRALGLAFRPARRPRARRVWPLRAFPGRSGNLPRHRRSCVQPGHYPIDRRQLAAAGRPRRAALRPGLALWPRRTGLTARAFRTGLAPADPAPAPPARAGQDDTCGPGRQRRALPGPAFPAVDVRPPPCSNANAGRTDVG